MQIRHDLENGLRTCTKCCKNKNIEDYPKDKRCHLGHTRTCKECVYNSKDKEVQKKLGKQWYQNNRELCIGRQKNRYEENKEKLRAYGRHHAKENPEIYKAARHRRRKHVEENGNNNLTAKQIVYLFDLQDFCTYCHSKENLTIDHILPISKGGQNTLANITVACGSCNNSKRAKLLDEFL